MAFVLHPGSLQKLALEGLEADQQRIELGTAKFDLTLSNYENADGLETRVEYATDLFNAGTIDRLLGHYTALLSSIAADPDCPAELAGAAFA